MKTKLFVILYHRYKIGIRILNNLRLKPQESKWKSVKFTHHMDCAHKMCNSNNLLCRVFFSKSAKLFIITAQIFFFTPPWNLIVWGLQPKRAGFFRIKQCHMSRSVRNATHNKIYLSNDFFFKSSYFQDEIIHKIHSHKNW